MQKREISETIYGIEDEYTCMVTLPDDVVHEIVGECHSVDTALELYQAPSNKGTGSITGPQLREAIGTLGIHMNGSGMLSNGARFYIDPSGPEYATPETRTAEEAVHRTFDGDRVVLGLFAHLRNEGVINGFQFNRRIVDHNRMSRGIHLNTMTTVTNEELMSHAGTRIAALNVAKGAIFGSGGLLLDKHGNTAFHHSPRLSITTDIRERYANYKKRPLVRYPLKNDGSAGRLETVASDALNFAWPLRASLVATNAILKVIELGYAEQLPRLTNPVKAARQVGQHGSEVQVGVYSEEAEKQFWMPLDVMRAICEVVLEVHEVEGQLDAESQQVIPEIISIADRMSVDPESAADQVESVARLLTMKKKMEKDGIGLDSEIMCRFDYAWDYLGGGGIASRLREGNKAGWLGFTNNYSLLATQRRMTRPPTDTRAKIRGDLIKASEGSNTSTWTNIDFGTTDYNMYVEPLSTTKPDTTMFTAGGREKSANGS